MANTLDKTKEAINAAAAAKKKLTNTDIVCMNIGSETMKKNFAMALPSHLQNNADRYVRSFLTMVRQNPKLANCEFTSLLGAMMTGTALGLDPSPQLGQFYIIPYDTKNGMVGQFQLGFQGMIALAYRAGVKKIWAHEVCKNDEFNLAWGLDEQLTHKPKMDGDRGEIIGYYVAAALPNDEEKTFFYLTKADALKHGKRFSKTFNSGPWQTDFDAMAKKTCAKQLFKWLPKSTELGFALNKDDGITRFDGTKLMENADEILEAETVMPEIESGTEAKKEPETHKTSNDASNDVSDDAVPINEEEETSPTATEAGDVFVLQTTIIDLFGDGALDYTDIETAKFMRSVLKTPATVAVPGIYDMTMEQLRAVADAAAVEYKKAKANKDKALF